MKGLKGQAKQFVSFLAIFCFYLPYWQRSDMIGAVFIKSYKGPSSQGYDFSRGHVWI